MVPGSAPRSKTFQYRMKVQQPASEERVSYKSDTRSTPLEKPVIRPLIKTGGKPLLDERQGRLKLERSHLIGQPISRPRTQEPERARDKTGFPEILFSRLLGGLIDGVAAVVAGSAAGFLIALYTGASVLSEVFVRDVVLIAGVFFFFSSTFLLYLSGQTLGMVATEIRLATHDGKSPRLSDIILRVFLLLCVTVSLVGLLWALFDRRWLCWHDYFSKTRVVPTDRHF